MGSGAWGVGSGQWAVGSGQWGEGRGEWVKPVRQTAVKRRFSCAGPSMAFLDEVHLGVCPFWTMALLDEAPPRVCPFWPKSISSVALLGRSSSPGMPF